MTLSQTATIQVDGLGLYGPLNACQLKAPFREHCLELTEKAEDENHRRSHSAKSTTLKEEVSYKIT